MESEREIEKYTIEPSVRVEILPPNRNTTIGLITQKTVDTKPSQDQMILNAKSFLASLADTSNEVSTPRVFAQKTENSWLFFVLSKADHLLTYGNNGFSRCNVVPPWLLQAGIISDNQVIQSRSYRLDFPSDQELEVKTAGKQSGKDYEYTNGLDLQQLERVLLAELIKKLIDMNDLTLDPDRINKYTYREREGIIRAFALTCQMYPEAMAGFGLEITPFEEHGSTKKMEENNFFASLESLGLFRKTGKIQRFLGTPEIYLNKNLILRRKPLGKINSWDLYLPIR